VIGIGRSNIFGMITVVEINTYSSSNRNIMSYDLKLFFSTEKKRTIETIMIRPDSQRTNHSLP